jgi:hypothetical protein
MMIIEGLLMEVVSIVIQYPLSPLYPVGKDEFQFRPLNFTQKFLNTNKKIRWPGELLFCQCRLHVAEKPEARSQTAPGQDEKADGVLEKQNLQRKVLIGF